MTDNFDTSETGEFDPDKFKHPALEDFKRGQFKAQFVAGKTLRWGAMGAVIGAAAVIGIAVAIGMAAVSSPIILAVATAVGVASSSGTLAGAGAIALAALTYGALTGAAVGGSMGAITASGAMDDAADATQEKMISEYDRMEAYHNKTVKLSNMRQQQRIELERQAQRMGISPNAGLPFDIAMTGEGNQPGLPAAKQGKKGDMRGMS